MSAASYLPDAHRMLPQAPESEQGILCSLLLSPEATMELCERFGVHRGWFHIPAHAEVFGAIKAILESQNPTFDFVKLTQLLRDTGKLEAIGGAGFISSLWTFMPTAANAPYYIRVARHKWRLREIVLAGTEFAGRAYDDDSDPEDDKEFALAVEFETRIAAINGGAVKSSANLSNKQLAMKTVEKLNKLHENRGAVTGIPTGFKFIDNLTNGLHENEVMVVAARPGFGKTAFAMNIAEHVAFAEEPCAVVMFSLEMSPEQMMDRFILSSAKINAQAVRDCGMTARDFTALADAAGKFASCDHISIVGIDETGGSIQRIRSVMRKKVKEFRKRGFTKIIGIIDYLQLCHSESRKSQSGNREVEVAEVSRGCKLMTGELKIPLIVLAQINRSSETEKRRPKLSDLRESGAIEQDADLVGFLIRPEMEVSPDDPDIEKLRGIAEFFLAKQRNGPSNETVRLTYLKEFTRFENRAYEPPPEATERPQSPRPKKRRWNQD